MLESILIKCQHFSDQSRVSLSLSLSLILVVKETFAPGTEVVIEGTRLKMMTWRLKSAESVPLPLSPLLWGLVKDLGFNGLHGTVVLLDPDMGRWLPRIQSFDVKQVDWNGARSGYKVQLSSADGSTGLMAKIKAENLRMLLVWIKWAAKVSFRKQADNGES